MSEISTKYCVHCTYLPTFCYPPSLYLVPSSYTTLNKSNILAGMTMVGVIPALVNSNLRQQSLLHTITVAKARAVVFSSELTSGEHLIIPNNCKTG